jgi:hypothetical protein
VPIQYCCNPSLYFRTFFRVNPIALRHLHNRSIQPDFSVRTFKLQGPSKQQSVYTFVRSSYDSIQLPLQAHRTNSCSAGRRLRVREKKERKRTSSVSRPPDSNRSSNDTLDNVGCYATSIKKYTGQHMSVIKDFPREWNSGWSLLPCSAMAYTYAGRHRRQSISTAS